MANKGISKKKWDAYRKVQKSGWTNMFNIQNVIIYAKEQSNVNLSREDCLEIMSSYGMLQEKYEPKSEARIYRGKRLGVNPDTASNVSITVEENGEIKNLRHHVYHSPTGMNWGYGGSGPADLACSLLWDVLGEEPSTGMYQDFKWAFVAGWKETWEISKKEILDWITQYALKKADEYKKK